MDAGILADPARPWLFSVCATAKVENFGPPIETAMLSPSPAHDSQEMFRDLQRRAREAGVALRPPPPEPTTCCGRGCNGCVWEGFYAAATFWQEDALAALAEAQAIR